MENITPDPAFYQFTLLIDPSTLCTAQQKKVSFYSRRIFTNPKVARTKKMVSLLSKSHRNGVRAVLNGADGIRLEATYYYAYQKSTAQKRRIDGNVRTVGSDVDNLHKAVQDALGFDKGKGADLWDDDHRISTLVIKKRYTNDRPRIVLKVLPDPDEIKMV